MEKYEVIKMPKADADLRQLAKSEPAAFRKAQQLLHELEDHPRHGTGQPERLKHAKTGQWSRRISQKHRLVYVIDDDKVIVLVLSAMGHYTD